MLLALAMAISCLLLTACTTKSEYRAMFEEQYLPFISAKFVNAGIDEDYKIVSWEEELKHNPYTNNDDGFITAELESENYVGTLTIMAAIDGVKNSNSGIKFTFVDNEFTRKSTNESSSSSAN